MPKLDLKPLPLGVPSKPNQVDQLFRAQLFHDRKQYEERRSMSPEERAKAAPVDYLKLGKGAAGILGPLKRGFQPRFIAWL